MQILEDFYYGNIVPWERTLQKDSDIHKISKQIIELENKLLDGIEDDKKDIYGHISEERHKRQDITDREMFICGFRLGAQLMMDVLNDWDKETATILIIVAENFYNPSETRILLFFLFSLFFNFPHGPPYEL